MSKRNDIHFNTPTYSTLHKGKRSEPKTNYREIRKILDQASDESEQEEETYRTDFSDMKAITKRRGVKAILDGKVLNSGCKKYKRWRSNDKQVIKEMLTPPLQEMYDNGEIGYRKAKRVRKIVTKRILSCFYAKGK